MNEIYFVTKNEFKFEELNNLFSDHGIKLIQFPYPCGINEIQTKDISTIILDKVIKAFSIVMHPVIVDHSGLSLDAFGGLPMGLTQVFWDALEENIAEIVIQLNNTRAKAITALAFCDGKNIYTSQAELAGTIVQNPIDATDRKFQWDTIFMPEGKSVTFSKMTVEEKNKISQMAVSVKDLAEKIKQINLK